MSNLHKMEVNINHWTDEAANAWKQSCLMNLNAILVAVYIPFTLGFPAMIPSYDCHN